MRPERAEYVPDVIANRLLAHVEHRRDLLRRCALPEHLQDLALACRQLRHPDRGISRLAGQHDSENRVAVVAVLDRHRADLGTASTTVANGRRLRSPNIFSAASFPQVIVPSLAATKLGTLTLLSVRVSSIDARFCGI